MKSINHCEGHFLDLGCGKGRTLVVAAYYGFKKVTGVDFSKAFCEEARELADTVKSTYRDCEFFVQHQDAFYYEIPDDVNVIYLFNPFDEVIMSGVVPQVAAMVGPGAAGTAYIPGLADFVPMVKGVGSLALAGPSNA